jgi:hypothetical protein
MRGVTTLRASHGQESEEGNGVMKLRFEDGPELREVFARLRAAGGPALAEGQTPCCYAVSANHPLLLALAKILDLIGTET